MGTTAQCVTGRLATIEEVVDWQPYEHVGWRLTVPGVGPVAATADLDPTESGTRLRLRWAYQGGSPADADAIERMRVDKEAAYARLATVIAGALAGRRPDGRSGMINSYRDCGGADVEHLRLIIDLRRPDLPLEDAALIVGWCASAIVEAAERERPCCSPGTTVAN